MKNTNESNTTDLSALLREWAEGVKNVGRMDAPTAGTWLRSVAPRLERDLLAAASRVEGSP